MAGAIPQLAHGGDVHGRPAGGPDLASTSPIYDGLRQI
jgi:hypothetical protein